MFTHLDYILWCLAAVLDLSVFAIMFRGSQYRRFPLFASYLGWKLILHTSNAVAMQHSAWAYFYTYWITTLINTIFGYAVIYEVFELKQKGFRRSFAFFLFLALACAVISPPTTANVLMASIRGLERVLFIVFAGLFAHSILLKPIFDTKRFAITLGFGIFSCVSLVKSAALSYSTVGANFVRVLPVIAYIVAGICWLVLLRKQEFSPVFVHRSGLLQTSQQLTTDSMALNSFMNSSR